MEGMGLAVTVFSVTAFVYSVRQFQRSRYSSNRVLRPQWLAIFLSRRVPRENVTLRDIEEEWSAYMVVFSGLGTAIGIAMIIHG
jgi:hypothetical protein